MPNAISGTARPATLPAWTPRNAPPPAEDGLRRWLTLAVVLTAAFLGTLDFFIINLALPAIQLDLHAKFSEVQLVIAGYGLAYAVCLITGGRLGDIFGRKRIFLLGVLGFTIASGLCGLARAPSALIAARVMQGVAGAMLFPQVLSIIQVTFPPHERGRAFGVFGVVQGAASFSGIVLGGLLVHDGKWQTIFLVNLPVGLLALVVGWFLIPESRSPKARRLDLGGVALVSIALFLIVCPLVEGREEGWPWWAFACLVLALPALWVFVRYEQRVLARGGSPLVELALFRNQAFAVGLLTSLAFCSGLSAFFLTVTLFLQRGLELTPTAASLAFAPFSIGYLVASGAGFKLVPWLGSRVVCLGAAVMAFALIGVIVVAQVRGPALAVVELMPLLLVYGIGQGLAFPTLISTALSRVPAADAGSASGVLTTFQQVAFSMGVTVIGGVFSSTLAARPHSHGDALAAALLCNVGLLALTFTLALWLPRRIAGETASVHVAEV